VEKRKLPSFTWVYLILIALSLVLIAVGASHVKPGMDWTVIAVGILGIVIVGATWPLSEVLAGERSDPVAEQKNLETIVERLEQISVLMNAISDRQLLSDRAKAVAYREKDRDALRRAIEEELAKQDWDAALALADNIEGEFGYKSEANRVREEVRARRQDVVRKQIQEVVAVIDRHTRSEQWTAAVREAERLISMYPDNDQVKNLPAEIDARRQAHKKQLLDSWNEAVARHDVDGSIDILKQLDTYLTPAEAEGMQETARQVFKEKLNLLSKQFSDAVRDHKWVEAMQVGESISREFPNTRIAQEVREKMDALRQRASEPLTPAAPPGSPPAVPAGA
jgi:hypothetical protein